MKPKATNRKPDFGNAITYPASRALTWLQRQKAGKAVSKIITDAFSRTSLYEADHFKSSAELAPCAADADCMSSSQQAEICACRLFHR